MTSSSVQHHDRLAALLERTGMRRASELPPSPAQPRSRPPQPDPGDDHDAAAGPADWGTSAEEDGPSWLPRSAVSGLETVDFRLDWQPNLELAVVPIVRRTAASGPRDGRRIYRWDEAWDARQLQALARGRLDAVAMQVVTLHDAACMAWGQDDPASAARFALAAVQAVIAGKSSICIGGERRQSMPIHRASAGAAVVAVPGGWALTLHDGSDCLDPALVRGFGGPPIRDGVWLAVQADTLLVLDVAPAIVAALARTRPSRDGVVPCLEARDLLDEIEGLRREGIEPRIDTALEIAREASAGRTEMRLANVAGLLYASLRVAPFGDAATWVPGAGEPQALALRDGELVRCERDLNGEIAHALALCHALGLAASQPSSFWWCFDRVETALDFLARLQAQSANLVLRWDSAPMTIAQPPAYLTLRVPSGVDWLGGKVAVDATHVELRALLEAMRDGRRFVEIRGGVWLEIRSRLRRQLHQAKAHFEQSVLEQSVLEQRGLEQRGPEQRGLGQDDGERDEPSTALARWNRTRHLLTEGVAVVADTDDAAGVRAARDAAVERLDARYSAAMAIAVEPPATLQATLRPYQREGVGFLVRTAAWAPGALLADEMGLGKTVQALAFLLHRASAGGALVVAPASVLCVWQREAAQFAPSLRVVVASESVLRRAVPPSPGELWLCSWAGLTRNVRALAGRTFATIVYDEAQMAKNPDTARAKAARALQAGFSLLLSGTPVENRALELWSLFSIAVPGLLGGSQKLFRTGRHADRTDQRRPGRARAGVARGAVLVAPDQGRGRRRLACAHRDRRAGAAEPGRAQAIRDRARCGAGRAAQARSRRANPDLRRDDAAASAGVSPSLGRSALDDGLGQARTCDGASTRAARGGASLLGVLAVHRPPRLGRRGHARRGVQRAAAGRSDQPGPAQGERRFVPDRRHGRDVDQPRSWRHRLDPDRG